MITGLPQDRLRERKAIRMSAEVNHLLDADHWRAYGVVYGFVGNELLTPMNRSHNYQGLEPEFWAAMPVPDNKEGARGAKRLEAYAKDAAAHATEGNDGEPVYGDDPKVPGLLGASVEFAHLFIGPPSPAADPWETVNDPRNKKKVGYGRATVEMQKLLAEEGLKLQGEHNQFEDHMGVELLYLSVLCQKAADAFADGGEDAVRPIADKAAWFINAHPLSWIGRFRSNVDASRPNGYYSALLEYVEGVLRDHYDSLM